MTYNARTPRATPGGAPLIPEEVQRQIVQSVEVESAALNLMPKARMRRAQQRIPVLTQLPTAAWVNGSGTVDGRDIGIKQTTQMMWDNVYLNAETLATIVPVSEHLIADMDYDFWEEVRPKITEAIAVALDQAVFFGPAPSSWPTPLAQQAVAAGNVVIAGTGVDYLADINNVMGAVEADGYDVNGFWARRQAKAKLRGLRSTTNELLYWPDERPDTNGAPGGTLYGERIFFSNAGLSGFATGPANYSMIAGDWTMAVLGIREDISMELFDQGVITDAAGAVVYNLMQQDMVALRVTARFGFAMPNPMNRQQTTNASRCAFGVIQQKATTGGE
jgi:HK97 family phage major capsid protein